MVENHLPGSWQARYARFNGMKKDTFRANAGETLELDYAGQVDQGSLSLEIVDPDNSVIWEKTVQANQAETVQVPLEEPGRYAIRIVGDNTAGSWDLNWKVQ